jgi:hypothetical protein
MAALKNCVLLGVECGFSGLVDQIKMKTLSGGPWIRIYSFPAMTGVLILHNMT